MRGNNNKKRFTPKYVGATHKGGGASTGQQNSDSSDAPFAPQPVPTPFYDKDNLPFYPKETPFKPSKK